MDHDFPRGKRRLSNGEAVFPKMKRVRYWRRDQYPQEGRGMMRFEGT